MNRLIELSTGEIIEELNTNFCAPQISDFLEKIGLLPNKQICTTEELQRFVFLHGNQDEIYTIQERRFIELIGDIYIYPEYYKKTKQGNMPCRVVAVDLSRWKDDIYYAVFFMKIIIKASVGFSIFVMKLNDGIHLGARLFDNTAYKNCILSKSGNLDSILDDLLWVSLYDTENFLDYYNSIIEVITPTSDYNINYEEQFQEKMLISSSYIEVLYEIEHIYGESIQNELNRYRKTCEDIQQQDFSKILADCIEELSDVRSTKVNTIEILFEAEELEKIANKTEEQRNIDFESSTHNNSEKDYTILEEIKDDPEAIIKKLKGLKGLIK